MQIWIQISLDGENSPFRPHPEGKPPRRGRRFETMQETHGENDAHKCKDCKHLLKIAESYTGEKYQERIISANNGGSADAPRRT
jgi:hypothetical protein